MSDALVRAGTVDEIREAGRKVVSVGAVPVLVLAHEGAFVAIDNRCPHMGFPLHDGDIHDGIIDCHWHHARFDVTCGATLDPWADDVDGYGIEIRDGVVFVDPNRPPRDPAQHGMQRLQRGLEHNIRLVIAKAAIEFEAGGVDARLAQAIGARFGASQAERGWQAGLTILSAMATVRADLAPEDRPRAQTQALAWIAAECAGRAPRRPLPGLHETRRSRAGLRDWLRETVEVRDADGAERVLRTLVDEHGVDAALDAVLAACTDHRYCDGGHTLDFSIKCAELVDGLGSVDESGLLITALVPQLVSMRRMEETSAWRRPVDVAALVADAAAEIPEFAQIQEPARGDPEPLADESALAELLLANDPARAIEELLRRARDGAHPVALAEAVVVAATRRILHFGTANEVPDWETVHHTQSYANAVAEGMRRAPSRELFRGVLDGAMSVYLDRFLNLPSAPLPKADASGGCLEALLDLYDRRASVDEVARVAHGYLAGGADAWALFRTLGHAVLREDASFHDYQQLEIAWRWLTRRGAGSNAARWTLVATARWLAARYPTRRAQEQTFAIASRLHRGEALHENG